jgi:integrase
MAEVQGEGSFPNGASKRMLGKNAEAGKSAGQGGPRCSPKEPQLRCPECGSSKLYRDGMRYLSNGEAVQRWLCRVCCYRFSEKRLQNLTRPLKNSLNGHLKARKGISSSRQVCVTLARGAKNLTTATETKTVAGEEKQTTKGKILQFALHCKNEGLTEETIRIWYNRLKKIDENAELNEPESVKAYIAKATFAQGTKYNMVVIYNAYLQFIGKTWKRPKYRIEEKLPEFIPTEQEIDALISGCGKKTAAKLQTIKETGMRIGEVLRLKWTWLDVERKILTLNAPEKHGRPRACKVSSKLVGMLQALPKKNELIFAGVNTKYAQNCFKHSRRKLARKLGNPRLAKIHFHLIRHWFGTMQYHKKPDLIHVQKLLGHRNILATQIYINLEQALFGEANDEYHVKVAETIEEATKLLAVGYEYVSTMDNKQIYRKRK